MTKGASLSSLDLSTNILWHAVSKDLFQSTKQQVLPQDIALSSVDTGEFQPLIANGVKKSTCDSNEGGTSWWTTSFLLVNTALGIGILNFPAAYDQAGGVISASLIQVVIVFLMMTTMLILAYCSDFHGDNTYQDVLMTMCGRRAQQLAALSITITLYCVCVASLIIIGDQVDSLFVKIFGPSFCHHWYLERRFTISVISVCFVWPLCYFKRVDFLGYVGPIGIFAMLYPVFLTFYSYMTLDVHTKNVKTKPDDYAAMFAVIPILGLGYQCQEVVVPVYSCMKDRNLWTFAKSCIATMVLLFFIYSVTGCFGYLTYGADVTHNIMKMFDPSDPVVLIGVGALIVKMVVTYPMLALCGRDAAIGLYSELTRLTVREYEHCEKTRRYVIATIWFTSSLVLAVFTSGIGIVIKYLGCIASANIYIYPGICLMRVVMKEDPSYESLRSKLLLALAVFITAFGFFSMAVILVQTAMSENGELPNRICS